MDCPHTIMIISTLSSLPSSHSSISAVLLRRRRRLAAVLSSPALFSVTLLSLQSLSLHHKSLLIAHHLFSNLTFLKSLALNDAVSTPALPQLTKLRDLDSALLLLLLCEVDHHHSDLLDAPPSLWRVALRDYFSDSILRVSSLGGGDLLEFVESVGRCWNLVDVMCCGGGKEEDATAASEVAVAALPSVEVRGGPECAICKEEMGEGSEVCELPCRHLFHWGCILRWFGKRNTCPCCRHSLPTGDVRREIRRLLDDLAEIRSGDGD